MMPKRWFSLRQNDLWGHQLKCKLTYFHLCCVDRTSKTVNLNIWMQCRCHVPPVLLSSSRPHTLPWLSHCSCLRAGSRHPWHIQENISHYSVLNYTVQIHICPSGSAKCSAGAFIWYTFTVYHHLHHSGSHPSISTMRIMCQMLS